VADFAICLNPRRPGVALRRSAGVHGERGRPEFYAVKQPVILPQDDLRPVPILRVSWDTIVHIGQDIDLRERPILRPDAQSGGGKD
jgi:hypothetical protein